ncbi:MAG: hypothetical protein R2838_15650 [Caldilineaceae bacterium]
MPTLLLIDGHSQAYRAYFGMKTPLSTRDGELDGPPSTALRASCSASSATTSRDHVAVAFDLGDTWRMPPSPSTRPRANACPTTCAPSRPHPELVTAFNIPIVTYPDYEAATTCSRHFMRQAAA